MEYINGITLADKDFRKSLDETLAIFDEVATGLHAMHLAGYVHADLKPTNIMVSVEGAVKLIDLGQSAKIFEPKTKIQGTGDYMAPEQVQRGKLDQRTDVFGLGATLHKVLTGRPIATDMNQTVNLQSNTPLVRRMDDGKTMATEYPACITRMINDCCQSDPAARIFDMPAVRERISLARAIVARKSEDIAAVPVTGSEVQDGDTDEIII
jgi:serine/threonine-protein kinase